MKRGKLQGKAAIALIIGGDLLLLLFGWFLLISPQRSTAASIVRATAAAEVQLEDAKKPVKPPAPAAVEKQPAIRTADLYSISKAMPSTEDMPDLLLQLDQVARDAGVTLKSISPAPATPSPTASFSTVPINLAFSGDFYSLTDMLYRLRSLVTVRDGALQTSGRLFSIGSVGFTPTGAGTQLDATVIVNAYVYGSTPASAAGAVTPPPATTSTDTTATTTTAPSADVAPGP
ncbi:MAG TPA: type 4a pilus biogenesis protein PilO [Gaiellaceae bacterium]|nr:type 4a pilus biogenesis protein PilO [Gaiellaceae bacterium]